MSGPAKVPQRDSSAVARFDLAVRHGVRTTARAFEVGRRTFLQPGHATLVAGVNEPSVERPLASSVTSASEELWRPGAPVSEIFEDIVRPTWLPFPVISARLLFAALLGGASVSSANGATGRPAFELTYWCAWRQRPSQYSRSK